MWASLGDWEAQARLRAGSQDRKHCGLLAANPMACRNCPFSPYAEDPWLEKSDEFHDLAGQALELYWNGEPDDTVDQFAMSIVSEAIDRHKQRESAILIAAELAKILQQLLSK